jgi:hypothetical protein
MNQGEFPNVPVCVLNHRLLVQPDRPADAATRFPFLLGIELELENVRGGIANRELVGWTQHVDESLRNGIEFVTNGPMSGDTITKAVQSFYAKDYRYVGSPRTSTHIHVNAGDLTVANVRTMFVISYMLEEAMFRVLEAKRKFCGYCMPLTEMSPGRVRNFLASNSIEDFARALNGPNAEKYYGFNAVSLKKHGTLEFRYFPGAPASEELLSWMDYCTAVKRIGLTYTLEDLSNIQDADELGRWLELNFGRWGTRMLNAVGQDAIFTSLSEVLAFVPDHVDAVARRDELVFVNPSLIGYMAKSYCTSNPQREWLVPKLEALKVMTANEWYELVNDSIYHAKSAAKANKVEIDYEPLRAAAVMQGNRRDAWAGPENNPVPEDLNMNEREVEAQRFLQEEIQAMRDRENARAADALRRAVNIIPRPVAPRPARPPQLRNPRF